MAQHGENFQIAPILLEECIHYLRPVPSANDGRALGGCDARYLSRCFSFAWNSRYYSKCELNERAGKPRSAFSGFSIVRRSTNVASKDSFQAIAGTSIVQFC